MPSHTDDVKTIHTHAASNPQACIADAKMSSANALKSHAKAFTTAHMCKVTQAEQVLRDFFPICKGVYVNHRANRGKPFSVVKADSVQWPRVSTRDKVTRYLKPIQDLGGEIVYSTRTNSVLIRIPCGG